VRAVLVLLVLLCLSATADAATLRAPSFTFTGTYTLTLDPGVRSATLRLENGQTVTGTGTQITLAVPDGLHTFTVNVTNTDGTAQVFTGSFTSQDLTPLIARQVQVAVEASHASQAAALQARDAALVARDESVDILNVSFAVQAAVHDANVYLAAIPPELQRQAEAQHEVAVELAQHQQALATVLEGALENQTRALSAAHKSVVNLQHALEALTVLVAAGIACLLVYVRSLRRIVLDDRAPSTSATSAPAAPPPANVQRRRPPRPAPRPPVDPPNLDTLLGLPPDGGEPDDPSP
jgi:hypothetical protein